MYKAKEDDEMQPSAERSIVSLPATRSAVVEQDAIMLAQDMEGLGTTFQSLSVFSCTRGPLSCSAILREAYRTAAAVHSRSSGPLKYWKIVCALREVNSGLRHICSAIRIASIVASGCTSEPESHMIAVYVQMI